MSQERFKTDGPQRIDFVREIMDIVASGKGINNTGSFYDSDHLSYQFYIYYTEPDDDGNRYQNLFGFNIFNKINVSKEWKDFDNGFNTRPDNVTVRLLADGTIVANATLDSENGWKYNFTDLPVYKIYYEPLTEPDFTVQTQQYDALNFTFKIEWEDDTPTADYVIVYPIKGQQYLQPYIYLTEEDNWSGSVILPKYNKNGTEITNYVFRTSATNAILIVTNETVANAITNIKVTLNNETLREKGVTIALSDYAEFAGVRFNSTSYEYIFGDLETYDSDGNIISYGLVMREAEYVNVINYTLEEVNVSGGYVAAIINETEEVNPFMPTMEQNSEKYLKELVYPVTNLSTGFKILNSYELTDLNVTKIWDDHDNKDGIRPEYVIIHVYSNQTGFDDLIVLNENNNWTKTISNIPKFDENSVIVNYTVEEVNVPDDYYVTIKNQSTNFTVINSHRITTFNLSINKTWNDSDNADGLRPDKLQVIIYADGIEYQRVLLTKEENWTYNMTLPKYINAKEVNYTVEEVVPEGYDVSYNISIEKHEKNRSHLHLELFKLSHNVGYYRITVTNDDGDIVTDGKVIVYNQTGDIFLEEDLSNGFVSFTASAEDDLMVNVEYPENEHYYASNLTVSEDDVLFVYAKKGMNPYLMSDGNYAYCMNWGSYYNPDMEYDYDADENPIYICRI